jgi:hypothetical protein
MLQKKWRWVFFWNIPLLIHSASVEIQTASKLEVGVESLILGLGTLCLTSGEFLMKKTLIALAAVAAMSTSFAQVSITGKLGFAATANGAIGGLKAKGLGVTDGDVSVKASEDLGNGFTASTSAAFATRGRDGTFANRDATITLASKDFVLTMGSVEAGSSLYGGYADATVSFGTGPDRDGGVLDAASNVDIIAATLPLGNLSLSATYLDVAGAGQGAIQGTQFAAAYNAGALTVSGDVTNFMSTAATLDGRVRTRIVGNYNAGVVKVGLGYQVANMNVAPQTTFGISMPLGAVTLGATFSSRAAQAANTGGQTVGVERSFSSASVSYALSKTSTLYAGFGTHSGQADVDNEYRVRFLKSF